MARDPGSRRFMCHVFRCDMPARIIANALRDVCKRMVLERSLSDPAGGGQERPAPPAATRRLASLSLGEESAVGPASRSGRSRGRRIPLRELWNMCSDMALPLSGPGMSEPTQQKHSCAVSADFTLGGAGFLSEELPVHSFSCADTAGSTGQPRTSSQLRGVPLSVANSARFPVCGLRRQPAFTIGAACWRKQGSHRSSKN